MMPNYDAREVDYVTFLCGEGYIKNFHREITITANY